MAGAVLRCRRCRKGVVDSMCLSAAPDESSAAVCTILHMDVDNLPDWVLTSVQQAQWTAGKLNCCFCGARLGGFNFLNHIKCPCGCNATVHLNKSRVDQDQKPNVPIVQPRRTGSASPSQMGPADDADGQKSCSLEADGMSTSFFCPADSRSESSVLNPAGPHHKAEAPPVSGARRSPLLQQTTESLLEMTTVHEEEMDSAYSLQGFTAQLEEVSSQPPAPMRLNKREKNHLKGQRRKQRRRERWLQLHLEMEQAENVRLVDSEVEDRDGLTCAVCLDVYFSPYSCEPCGHVFCELCLRTLAKNRPTNTSCPLCRALVSNTSFSRDLDQRVRTSFPKVYASRKQNFQNAPCARWPLPNSHKPFRPFWDYRQNGGAARRRWHFAHGGFTPGALIFHNIRDFHLNIDLVFLDFPSLCWILALKLLCVLIYYFVL
uniref:Ring finger protein 180 n=1 Tax=Iconisemion striatum TaxID=60296 RepID=A0A1A7WBF4_9TELE